MNPLKAAGTRFSLLFLLLCIEVGAVASKDFGEFHPDQEQRLEGLRDFEVGRFADARQHFLRASRYADKASQAMLAELYWRGLGVERDRGLAYVWADLAAERGYELLLVVRERFWKRMNRKERERALEIGPEYYAEYGDDVAKPRLEALLERGLSEATGSRVGATSGAEVWIVTGADLMTPAMTGQRIPKYYHPDAWHPRSYWRAEELRWEKAARHPSGIVEVLPLRDEAKVPGAQDGGD